ncbi:hypothetical protein VTL71DRAFT_7372 [Oculimacula yallundae]
MLKSF